MKNLLILLLSSFLTSQAAIAEISDVTISYQFPKQALVHQPIVYLVLSKKHPEPKQLISNWFDLPILFSVTDSVGAGEVEFKASSEGSEGELSKLEPGTYWLQAVVRLNNDWPMPGQGEGDLYSDPQKVEIRKDQSLSLKFSATHEVAAPNFRQTGLVRDAYFRSKSLSQFHERPFKMRYTVLLPDDWKPGRKYPVVVYIFGFSGVHTMDDFIRQELGEGCKDVIVLCPDANCYWGHSVFLDSEVNGPWGTALTEELIPFVEKEYGGLGPEHRYVTGTSSGGWASLWLKLRYPDKFESSWSCAPDPLDFSKFLLIDLYESKSLYVKSDGTPIMMTRPIGGMGRVTFQQFGHYERFFGPGGQLRSFGATFCKRQDDGSPEPWYDERTGELDHDVIKQWKPYELTDFLPKQLKKYPEQIRGKVNLTVHREDIFYLDRSFDAFESACKKAGAEATFHRADGMGHHITQDFANQMFATIKGNLNPVEK